MARAGMLHRGGKNGADGGDDVQRSLELLDKVLSEFDEGEPRSLDSAAVPDSAAHTPATPDDDSPSLAGHQSEDDGYMSMNGRRAKFALGFRPTDERAESEPGDTPPSPPRPGATPSAVPAAPGSPCGPPPPEEAERIISTLLPKVSPANSAKRNIPKIEEQRPPEIEKFDSIISINGTTTATQTTLPKTRHQRPYGWEKSGDATGFQLQPAPAPPCRFASLPYGSRPPPPPGDGAGPAWLPQRHLAPKRSPSLDNPPVFPFVGLSGESDKPYNEHPVTIYPGPARQLNKLHSPTYLLPRVPPYNPKSGCLSPEKPKKNAKPDERIETALSPKSRIPPRTLAGSMERHREVCRSSLEDAIGDGKSKRSSKNNDEDHFSDDSLEESFPPPPPPAVTTPSKRNSIAWEVSLDIDDPLLTPGSTKVIGRRRRKSGDNSQSSTGSIPQQLEESEWGAEDYWPPPPTGCSPDPALASPESDTESDPRLPPDLNTTGTYVIRKGKNRKQLPAFAKSSSKPPKTSNLNRYGLNRSLDADKSIDGSSISMSGSGLSGSHNSVSSYSSRLSSDLSIPQARYTTEPPSRLGRDLLAPGSRYSIDLGAPNSRFGKEITSPKSRLSLDLNNGLDRHVALEYLSHSPKSFKATANERIVPYTAPYVPNKLSPQNRFTDFKKYSSTFDNIRSLMKEGKMEECEPSELETVCELATSAAPGVVRVVSLPSLANDKDAGGGSNGASRAALITTVEEEEDPERNSSEEASPLRKIENNISAILSQGRDQKHFTSYAPKDWNIHRDEYCDDISTDMLEKNVRYGSRERPKRHDIQKSSSHNEIGSQRSRSAARRSSGVQRSPSAREALVRQPSSSDSAVSSGGDFPVNVHIVEHVSRGAPEPELGPLPQTPESPAFPPLPPSPVQEVDDEYSEILQPREKLHSKADTLPTPNTELRHRSSEPPAVPPHRDSTNSLKTRSMEAGYSKNKRNTNFKSGSTDRRTLPTDMAASGVRRRTLQRQGREATPPGAAGGGGTRGLAPLQTSASLPETPIFARGCDVPRTPLRHTSGLGPRQSNTMNSIQTMSGISTLGGYARGGLGASGTGVERALAGAELLRLAGGPARGWYPRQRHRPASIEHLDRLTVSSKSERGGCGGRAGWESEASRKPLTLPPNLTPKFFQRSPREALRRVTSLLIRKGNNGKEKEPPRGKEATSPAARSANGEDHPGQKQRKGFFKSLWKRSRHYSLEQP